MWTHTDGTPLEQGTQASRQLDLEEFIHSLELKERMERRRQRRKKTEEMLEPQH